MHSDFWAAAEQFRAAAAPQIQAARAEIEAPWLGLDPKVATGQLEASLENHLILHFGASPREAAAVLSSIPAVEPTERRDALLDFAATCIYIIANDLNGAFLTNR